MYRRALQIEPELGHIWVQLGNMAKEHGSLEESEAAYLRASQIRPDDAEPFLQLGHLLRIQKDVVKATQFYLRAFRGASQRLDAVTALQQIVSQAQGAEREQIIAQLRTGLPEFESSTLKTESSHSFGTDAPGARVNVAFDVSDLMIYFLHARLPTGIQRVQLQIVTSALKTWNDGVCLCCLVEGSKHWTEVPGDIFQRIAALSLQGSDQTDADWLGALCELQLRIAMSRSFDFPIGAYLVNLGASWQVPNYFLFVRDAKARYDVRYVPFVHDLIAIVAPEHFVKGALREFIPWVISIMAHADHFLVNSSATRRDLLQTGGRLGRRLDPASIAVIRLDADFRAEQGDVAFKPPHESALNQWQLDRGPFVLMVSTVESRKGHATALDAWAQLIARHGAAKVPMLVCAGRRGWLSGKVYQRLDDDLTLASRVMMLSTASDSQLSQLYQNCLFTLYPSLYEGWGLPITESLCYSKPVIASDNSSLPEAGGDFAVYVDAGDSSSLAAASERMIFDADYRNEIATRIGAEFRPRSWTDLADQIWLELKHLSEQTRLTGALIPVPVARPGAYHSLGRSVATQIMPGAVLGEAFRVGGGWSAPEEAGNWTRPTGGMLAIGLPPRHRAFCLGLLLLGAPECDVDWRVWVKGGPSLAGSLSRHGRKWITLTYPAIADGDVLRLRLQSEFDQLAVGREIESPDRYTVGIAGFFLHFRDDIEARSRIMEAITLGNLDIVDAFPPSAPLQSAEVDWDG